VLVEFAGLRGRPGRGLVQEAPREMAPPKQAVSTLALLSANC